MPLFLLLLIFIGCQDEYTVQPKEYPFLLTQEVSHNNSTGVTFRAKVLGKGNTEITDFGFIWGVGETEYQYSIKQTASLEDFTMRVSSDLEKNLSYFCRAYIKTDHHLVLGNKVLFESKGSGNPVIDNFTPKEGFDGTTITLNGKNFSLKPERNQVLVNDIPAETISSSENQIVFKLPSSHIIGDAFIELEMGNKTAKASSTIKIMGPEIESVSTMQAYSGYYVTLQGKNFTRNGNRTSITLGTDTAKLINLSDHSIEFIVPALNVLNYNTEYWFNNVKLPLQIINGLKKVNIGDFEVVKTWGKLENPPFTSLYYAYQAVAYNGKGYIFDHNPLSLIEYDRATDKWGAVGETVPYSGERYEGGLYMVSGDKLYKIGGYNYLWEFIQEVWQYDFNSKEWSKRKNIPFKVYDNKFSTIFTLNHQSYVISFEGEVWKCDFEKEVYTRLKDFPIPLPRFQWLCLSFVADNEAYVVAGQKTWKYNEVNDTWTEMTTNPFGPPLQSQYNATCFSLHNAGYLISGRYQLYKYDHTNNRWILVSYVPRNYISTEYSTVFTMNDVAYISSMHSSMLSYSVPY